MATDYTVIQAVRQRFGDSPSGKLGRPGMDWGEYPVESEAPFVGASKDFSFNCPSVDRSQWGILQFAALGVSDHDNVIQINGVDVAGGIGVGPSWPYLHPHVPLWNMHSLLVEGRTLREQNVLHIESSPDADGNLDDFLIDNVVIWFKTTRTGRDGLPTATEASQ
jgi:hypothetical protein